MFPRQEKGERELLFGRGGGRGRKGKRKKSKEAFHPSPNTTRGLLIQRITIELKLINLIVRRERGIVEQDRVNGVDTRAEPVIERDG